MQSDAAFWDGLAERYAAKPVEDPDAFDRKTAITRALLTPESVVLDVGCGTGSLALRLAPSAREVHGLDVSGEMLRIARGKAAEVPNVHFHQGTLDDVPLEPGSLSGVLAYSLLHLVDHPVALRAIYDLIEPGGFFVSSTVVLGDSWMPYPAILSVMRWLGKAPVVHVLKRQTVVQAIIDAGFVAVEQPDVGAESTVLFAVARKPSEPPAEGSHQPSVSATSP